MPAAAITKYWLSKKIVATLQFRYNEVVLDLAIPFVSDVSSLFNNYQ